MKCKIGIIGLGNVGLGLVRILHNKRKALKGKYGFDFEITAISDLEKGSVYDENGLDLGNKQKSLLSAKHASRITP